MSQGDGVSQGDGDFDPRANAPSPLHRATCPPDSGDRGLDTGTGVVSRGSLWKQRDVLIARRDSPCDRARSVNLFR